MLNLPSIEVIESRHDFPCVFTFKVIGESSNNFHARVIAAVRHELQLEIDPPHSCRTAKNGKHIAVTIEPEIESSQQVIAVYGRLTGMDGLVMLL